MKFYTFIFTALLFISSCGSESPTSNKVNSIKPKINTPINDSIKLILRNSALHNSIYENGIRVGFFKNKLNSSYNFNSVFNYARELLNNGQTELARKTMQDILDNNPQLKTIDKNSIVIHKFLAICNLRKGEQENCLKNHNDESCIVPIKNKGIYNNKIHSKKAIEIYQNILRIFPGDMESMWLLNVAFMTTGEYPQKVPKKYLIDINEDNTKSLFENVGTQVGIDHFGLSGSVIIDDFNNDNLLDVFTTSWGTQGKVKFFTNLGEEGFIDQTGNAGLNNTKGGLNVKQTDYNNDGFLDIFIMRGAWIPNSRWGILPNSLLKNNGDGTFLDVTLSAGLYSTSPCQSAEWFDYNNDGHLDLFIANETTKKSDQNFPCQLYQNNGDGTFKDVAKKYNLDKVGYFKGCSSGDVNNDGWMDLYLSNLAGDNLLFTGYGNNQIFEGFKETNQTINLPLQSFPCWLFDFNNDGHEDIFAASFDNTAFMDQSGQFARNKKGLKVDTELSRLYENDGTGKFIDRTERYIKAKGFSTMGCNYGDIDNDGLLDFYLGTGAPDFRAVVPNRLFNNNEKQGFKDITFNNNLGHIQKGHGISFADLDNDGDQDIYAVMGGAFKSDKFSNAVFKNKSDKKNSWLKLKLIGTTSNKPAIGAKIKIVVINKLGTTKTIYKTINSGASFGANPLTTTIGLGNIQKIETAQIKWPNGSNKWINYSDIISNSYYHITEDKGKEKIALKAFDMKLTPADHSHNHH